MGIYGHMGKLLQGKYEVCDHYQNKEWHLGMHRKLWCLWNSQVRAFMCKKKRKKERKTDNEQFCGQQNALRISGISQAYLSSFKGFYQQGYYCKGCLCMYGQNSLKVQDSEEKPAFLLRLLLRSHIAQLAMFSVDPGILLSLDHLLVIHCVGSFEVPG